ERALSTRKNRSVRRGRSCAGMPIPESSMAISTKPVCSVPDASTPRTSTRPPCGVYLMALSTRLIRTWRRRSPSACTRGHPGAPRPLDPPAAPRQETRKDLAPVAHRGGDRQGVEPHRRAAELEMGEREEIVDQAPEALGVAIDHGQEAPGGLPIAPRRAEERL